MDGHLATLGGVAAETPREQPATGARVVLYASIRGVLAGIASPLVLVGLGGAAIARGGVAPLPLGVLLIGVALAVVVVLDVPRRVEFDTSGITRVCPLRRQRLPWDTIVAIERVRPTATSTIRGAVDRRTRTAPKVTGGLAARGNGKRRWLLTDRIEGQREHDQLVALIDGLDAPVVVRAVRPHADAPPTDLYRRRRGP